MVLMSEGYGIKEEKYGRLFDATALARHLSNDSRDRFFQDDSFVHSTSPGDCMVKSVRPPQPMLELLLQVADDGSVVVDHPELLRCLR